MSTADVISLISLFASIASLVLAIMAIWLSIAFFKMSSELSQSTTEAAKDIGASVERLEKLFDKLYADTFSMMRDTVSDMRKHMWPEDAANADHLAEEIEQKANAKINELQTSIEQELAPILQQQRITDKEMARVRSEMQHVVERAITGSRQVELEAREETLREHILAELHILGQRGRLIRMVDLYERLGAEIPLGRLVVELGKLKEEGVINMNDSDDKLATRIYLRQKSSAIPPPPPAPKK